jgi:hypothetical protein
MKYLLLAIVLISVSSMDFEGSCLTDVEGIVGAAEDIMK